MLWLRRKETGPALSTIVLRSILESQGCQVRDHTEHVLLPRAGDSKEE